MVLQANVAGAEHDRAGTCRSVASADDDSVGRPVVVRSDKRSADIGKVCHSCASDSGLSEGRVPAQQGHKGNHGRDQASNAVFHIDGFSVVVSYLLQYVPEKSGPSIPIPSDPPGSPDSSGISP